MTRLKSLILLFIFIASIATAALTGTIGEQKASALSGNQFKAGRIIDDQIFFNGQGMSLAEIQGFLNAKMPSCDTYGAKPSGRAGYATRADWGRANGANPPYTCLKDYRQTTPTKAAEANLCNGYSGGDHSAAQMIYQVSVSCGINPKVLLVLLQKEQSLLSDDWPWPIQYRAATGYGCPDTAPCDADYYGFFNQVYNAARQFKRYTLGGFNYKPYSVNYITYAPNTSSCSSAPGSYVYIENKATAALYNYTPYQPNQAALNNLYGTGDGCSAYGNRNFWRLYNDWFGPTTMMGVRASSDSNYANSRCTPPVLGDNQVARLYNPDTTDYLLTTNANEVCTAIRYGYIWDGIAMQGLASNQAGASPVYRLAGFGRHIYTSSTATRDNFNNKGYVNEGIGFYVYTSAQANTTPVSCLVNGDLVIYSSSGGEIYGLQQQGFTNLGTAFLTPSTNTRSQAARFSDSQHRRLYTASDAEKQSAGRYGFSLEQTTPFDIETAAGSTNTPLYRLRDPYGQYFYTTNRVERDLAVINYGYYSEGIVFYTAGNSDIGSKSIYRLTDNRTGLRLYTPSTIERDQAVWRYGYDYEFVSWYGY